MALALEGEPQPELDLSGSTERVDACSYPNAVHVVSCASGSVDLSRGSRQQSIQRVARQIKIGEVEQVVKPGAGLHAEPLTNRVRPTDFQIESAQPGEIDLAGRCQRHGRCHSAELLQLLST